MSTFTSTFTASNGSQSKTLAHTFTVYATSPITLSATFPSNLHVGDTGSFVVTATEADGATGSLTITADTLPDGMTLGATTDNGDGTFSATVDYDLTTEQTVTATFSATGGSVAATPLQHEFVVQATSSEVVDDFSVAGTGANWTITEQGTATGTGEVTGGNLVLTPTKGQTNSVAARRPGAWTSVKVNAKLTPLDALNGTPRYFDISIGNGDVAALATAGSWWHTSLANAYTVRWQNGNHKFSLVVQVNGVSTSLADYDTNFPDEGAGYHDYELRIEDGAVKFLMDGVVVMDVADTTYTSGDALIAQGATDNFDNRNDGCAASVSTVTLTP